MASKKNMGMEIMKKILKKRKDGVRQGYWHGNIDKLTVKNKYFRKVLYTAKNEQLVVMSIPPYVEIGNEVHKTHDQFFRIESGTAKFILENKKRFVLGPGGSVIVRKGTWHNVINNGHTPLKLYTLYATPADPPRTIDKTKMDAIIREKGEHK